VNELWRSVSIWRSYRQDYGVLFFWLTVLFGKLGIEIFVQCYKWRTFCTEALFADNRGKEIIPLLLETGYQPNGWLGLLVSNKLYFDFSVPEKFESSWHMLYAKLNVVMSAADIRDTGLYVYVLPQAATLARYMRYLPVSVCSSTRAFICHTPVLYKKGWTTSHTLLTFLPSPIGVWAGGVGGMQPPQSRAKYFFGQSSNFSGSIYYEVRI